MRVWLFAVSATIICTPAREAAGQAAVTTRSGVYTAPQASRGEDVYVGYCKSCHTPESHTGAQFRATWNGRKLSDLFSFIRERMPKNDPASLSDGEYADVTAYLLKLNKMPLGKTDLPADSTRLAAIRIVTNAPIKIVKASTTSKSSTGSKP
jgi:S-disulfanyl-L-cysteine oxidoreductase SoxD